MIFARVTHRPAKVVANLSHRESHPGHRGRLLLIRFIALSPVDHRQEFPWKETHTNTGYEEITKSDRARTSATALGSVATTTSLHTRTNESLRESVVEGDYLRPCISTLTSSDDQTITILATPPIHR